MHNVVSLTHNVMYSTIKIWTGHTELRNVTKQKEVCACVGMHKREKGSESERNC